MAKKGEISLELEKGPVTSADLLVMNDCNSEAVRMAAPWISVEKVKKGLDLKVAY